MKKTYFLLNDTCFIPFNYETSEALIEKSGIGFLFLGKNEKYHILIEAEKDYFCKAYYRSCELFISGIL